MLNLLLSLPEANLLTFLFLLDHLKRYPGSAQGLGCQAPLFLRPAGSPLLGPWGYSPPLGTRASATLSHPPPLHPGLKVRCLARLGG